MIPKIIHYIWFGRKPYPPKILTCIASWKKFLPDYEFKLWNEESFDISNACLFVRQAYANKKYAHVSDYVRLWALYNYGGFYLDTDVEVIRRWSDDLCQNYAGYSLDESGYLSVVMFSEKANPVFRGLLDIYDAMPFVNSDGTFNMEVNNTYIQNELSKMGYNKKNVYQVLNDGSIVYPDDYFHCRSLTTGKLHITDNSVTIHWHTITWVSAKTKFLNFLRIHILVPLLGTRFYSKISKCIKGDKSSFWSNQ